MSDAVSCVEIEGQRVELLPARTVMSLFTAGGGGGTHNEGGNGGGAKGGLGVIVSVLPITVLGDQTNSAGDAFGGRGGNAG
ncbi:MAG: hypothetical protein ACRDRW_13080 [Pseudonocardiaceae bacterium]